MSARNQATPIDSGATRRDAYFRTPSHWEPSSAAFRKCLAQVKRFARDCDAVILIEGESGTGKTQIAKLVHDSSPRRTAPFHDVVLSTLDDSLAGSELFGHVQGAFTDARQPRAGHFASAHGGTLFLDEIGKASLPIQQKLLHAIEYGEIRPVGSDRRVRVDVRVVAATNISLGSLVEDDRFLPDLQARLDAFRIQLPPLRHRRPDIPMLVEQYVAERSVRSGYDVPPRVDAELMSALQRAPWPNNLRQLASTVHRILVDADGARVLTLDHCIDDLSYLREGMSDGPRQTLTRARVDDALATCNGSISAAARLLGVDRTTLHRFRRRSASL
jgi:DNA-binding NtrC family response regulator